MALHDFLSRKELFDAMKTLDACPNCKAYDFTIKHEHLVGGKKIVSPVDGSVWFELHENFNVYYIECENCHTIYGTCAELTYLPTQIRKEIKSHEENATETSRTECNPDAGEESAVDENDSGED